MVKRRLRSAVEHGFRNHEQRLDIARTKTQSSKECDEGTVLRLPAFRRWSVRIEEELGKRDAQGVGEPRQCFEVRQALRAQSSRERKR